MQNLTFFRGDNQDEFEAIYFLALYDLEEEELVNKYQLAAWAYDTNITAENAEAVGEVLLRVKYIFMYKVCYRCVL